MKLEFIVIGKIKENYLKEGIKDYSARLSRGFDFSITEIAEQRVPDGYSVGDMRQILAVEEASIRKVLREKSFKIVMAIEGKELSSPDYAKMLETKMANGVSDVQIIIGSTLGVSQALKEEADFLFSLGKPTYPHQLMRLIILEQTYRAMKIMRNEKYHN